MTYNFIYILKFLQNPIGGLVKQLIFVKDGNVSENTLLSLPENISVYENESGWFDLNSIQICMDEARG